jgi:hypothetical protein
MKPNSSWSLKQNDKSGGAKIHAPSAGGGAPSSQSQSLMERRVLWFVQRAPEKRASAADLAGGLALNVEEVRGVVRQMIRKGMLRELPRTEARPEPCFMVGTKFIQESARLAAGPDPAQL